MARMGQSGQRADLGHNQGQVSGPFAGQCFVGDQTRSMIMRVYLERSTAGFRARVSRSAPASMCGINRLEYGLDGSLYAGQTNRGWGFPWRQVPWSATARLYGQTTVSRSCQ